MRISIKVHFEHTAVVFVPDVKSHQGKEGVNRRLCGGLPIEHFNSSLSILLGSEYNCTKPARASVWTKCNVSTHDSTCLPKEIFEILPLAVKRELIEAHIRYCNGLICQKPCTTHIANKKISAGRRGGVQHLGSKYGVVVKVI